MNDQIQQLMVAAGAMAELIYMHYTSFMKVGFSDSQAMYLCGKMMEGFLNLGKGNDDV